MREREKEEGRKGDEEVIFDLLRQKQGKTCERKSSLNWASAQPTKSTAYEPTNFGSAAEAAADKASL